ncbi:MAG: AMP-binding protein [Myxococcales bacterium]
MLRGAPLPPVHSRTLVDLVTVAAGSPHGLTFIDAREEETQLSFADLSVRAAQAAAGIASLGVNPGDRVAMVLPTGAAFMDAFFGAILAGAVPVPLYPPVRLGRLDEFHLRTSRMIEVSGARLVLTDGRIGRLLGQSIARARPQLGCRTVSELPRVGKLRRAASPDDLALVQFSSGTTVDPKPVALTHANVLSNVAAIDSYIPPGAEQSGVSWLPLYHDMGLLGCLLIALYHPGPLALLPPEAFLARPAIWLRAISRHRATITVAPNFAFGLCLKRIRDDDLIGCSLSSLRLVLDGAEPIGPAVLRRFADRFGRFGFDARALLPVYGLSEAALAVTFAAPGSGLRTATVESSPGEVAAVGTPVPGVDVRIVRPDASEAPDGTVGRIEVRGPSVMTGYLEDPAATAKVVKEGWLDTGDLGTVIGGELYVCGREKEVVILRGANHAPQEFEDALLGLRGVREGCTVAAGFVPEGADGEELLLLVEQTAPLDPDAVRARVVAKTGVRPHTVALLAPGTLPRTSSGKLRRGEALRQWLTGTLRPPRKVTALHLLRESASSLAAFARLRLSR